MKDNIEIILSKETNIDCFSYYCHNRITVLYTLLTICDINRFEKINKIDHMWYKYEYSDDLIKSLY